jgi:hypothetical protein
VKLLARVAAAIEDADWGDYRQCAREALQAAREPDPVMIDAVASWIGNRDLIVAMWQAMIDAAVNDNAP